MATNVRTAGVAHVQEDGGGSDEAVRSGSGRDARPRTRRVGIVRDTGAGRAEEAVFGTHCGLGVGGGTEGLICGAESWRSRQILKLECLARGAVAMAGVVGGPYDSYRGE